MMHCRRPPLFRTRKFEPIIIVTCSRCTLRFCLSLRDVEEIIPERGLFAHIVSAPLTPAARLAGGSFENHW